MDKRILKNKCRDPGDYRHWMPPLAWNWSNWEHWDKYPNLRILMPTFAIYLFVTIQLEHIWQAVIAAFAFVGMFFALNFIWAHNKAFEHRRSQRNATPSANN